MRIEGQNLIKVISRGGAKDFLRGLKNGAEINARILEKNGTNMAVLDIGGRRIRAQFEGPLPPGDSVRLKLEGFAGSVFRFKIIHDAAVSDPHVRLAGLSLFSTEQLAGVPFGSLAKILRSTQGLYEFNSALVSLITGRDTKSIKTGLLFQRLENAGLGRESLMDLAAIFMPESGRDFILPLFFLLNGKDRYYKKWKDGDRKDIEQRIVKILDEVVPLFDNINEPVSLLSELLRHSISGQGSGNCGEWIWPAEDGSIPILYLQEEGNWIFSFEMSHLGRIDLLAKESDKFCSILICCENAEAMQELKNSLARLKDAFDLAGIKPVLDIILKRDFSSEIIKAGTRLSELRGLNVEA